MPFKLAIFDFDGTLADTFSIFLDVFDLAAERFGFMPFDRANLDHIRTQSAKNILRCHRVPPWKLFKVSNFVRSLMEQRVSAEIVFPDIPETLHALSSRGIQLALVSSNSPLAVETVLGPSTFSLFTQVECGISLFGKTSRLKKLLSRTGSASTDAIFIGDEIRDAIAARDSGLPFGAVAWGYTDFEALKSHGATCTFKTPSDILNVSAPFNIYRSSNLDCVASGI